MVKLRLRRMGRRNTAFYRIVAVDARVKRDGKYLEQIGIYDPLKSEDTSKINCEKAIKWLELGAQPTDTVKSLLTKEGILKIWHEKKIVQKSNKKKGTESDGN